MYTHLTNTATITQPKLGWAWQVHRWFVKSLNCTKPIKATTTMQLAPMRLTRRPCQR